MVSFMINLPFRRVGPFVALSFLLLCFIGSIRVHCRDRSLFYLFKSLDVLKSTRGNYLSERRISLESTREMISLRRHRE